MSHLNFKAYPELGERQVREFYYSQSVAIPAGGSYVHLSGQGAWLGKDRYVWRDGIEAQVEQAFANVELALKDCGATMDNVFEFTTYTVPHDIVAQNAIVRTTRRVFPKHAPLWTDIGVKSLAVPEMLIEIKVIAHIPAPST